MKQVYIIGVLFAVGQALAANYYVATNGNDLTAGAIGTPFATIQHAADVMGEGDTCYIRGGNYHEEVVVNNLNGTSGSPITFSAYNNEVVALDGSRSVEDLGSTGWTQHSGNIYKTTLTSDITQVFVDGEWMMLARWPNARFDDDTAWDRETHWAQGNEALSSAGLEYDDPNDGNDLAASGLDMTDAMLIINLWGINASMVTNHVAGSDHFQYVETDWNEARHYYFMDSKLNLLDNETEWYFDPSDNTLYLWMRGGGMPTGDIRGKTMANAFTFSNCQYVTVKNLDFFATTFQVSDGNHITVEDCDLNYPVFNRRTLGDYGTLARTHIDGSPNFAMLNCSMGYTDGVALRFDGSDFATVENCEFHHIDYSCGHQSGQSSSIWFRNSEDSVYRRNTMYKTGSGHGVIASSRTLFELNDFSDLAHLQHDAAAIHLMQGHRDVVVKNNWFHDLRRPAVRFSDGPKDYLPLAPLMRTGILHHNISINSQSDIPIQLKGDERQVYNNLCEGNMRFSDDSGDPSTSGIHANTISANNSVGTYMTLAPSAYVAPSGTHSNNWEGGLLSLNIKDQVRDWTNRDYRPRPGSDWIDGGMVVPGITDGYLGSAPDIGAYESGDSSYWIPGRKLEHASKPVPPAQASSVKLDADLMWLGAYEATSHTIYFGLHPSTMEWMGNFTNNIFNPGTLASNSVYYWRADAVTPTGTVEGVVWQFDTSTPSPQYVEVGLLADPANSSVSGYGGSVEKTLNDPFVYDPSAPEIPLPFQTFSTATGRLGFHGNEAEGVDVVIAYSLEAGVLSLSSNQLFAIDLYGRDGYSDRDDNIDVALYDGLNLVTNSTGNAIAGAYDHARIVLQAPASFDRIVITGHDSGATGNQFTLMEMRAAMEAPPSAAELYADWANEYALGVDAGYGWDADGDRLDNLTEYGLGGVPTNGSDAALILPTFGTTMVGNALEYVYRRRTDAAARGLIYTLEESTNLVSNDWNIISVLPSGTAPLEPGFEAVTNQIPATETNQFIRLRISID
ncbi:right-handed parallel beta-helix repeat-containing protein [Pontiella sulfatireligans]|nr:right-handed parallel beta-helix repeat-containing protein [Pontiella sulfatireligans]